MKRKRMILTLVVVLLLIVGVFFILRITVENKKNIQKQEEILMAIEGGEHEIDIEIKEDETEQDYYLTDSDSTVITPLPSEVPSLVEPNVQVSGLGIIEIEIIDLKLPIVEGVQSGALAITRCIQHI